MVLSMCSCACFLMSGMVVVAMLSSSCLSGSRWSTREPDRQEDESMATTTIPDIKKHAQEHMDKTIAGLKTQLSHVRTGRANPGLLDTVHVEYYGTVVPLSQVANISLLD